MSLSAGEMARTIVRRLPRTGKMEFLFLEVGGGTWELPPPQDGASDEQAYEAAVGMMTTILSDAMRWAVSAERARLLAPEPCGHPAACQREPKEGEGAWFCSVCADLAEAREVAAAVREIEERGLGVRYCPDSDGDSYWIVTGPLGNEGGGRPTIAHALSAYPAATEGRAAS